MDDSLRNRVIEHAGRQFDIRLFLYGGDLLEAAPFEGGRMAELPYPGGLRASPLYQLNLLSGAEVTDALLDSLIETAEADIRRRVQ